MDTSSLKILLAGSSSVSGEEYIGTYRFTTPQNYTTFTWTVPADVVYIQAFCLGSGGLNDGYPNSLPGGDGGGGGCSRAVRPVTAGESLRLGVGQSANNGASSKSFGGSGGGFSGIFRGSTPLIIAGGGGGGQVNGTNYGGAGGGLQAQSSQDGYPGGGQSAGSNGSGYLSSGIGGGGGYYGGGGSQWYYGSGGGSGYIGSSGILHAQTATGSGRLIPSLASSNRDYQDAGGTPPSGMGFGYGGIGNDSGAFYYGSGLVVIHTLGTGYNPASTPTIPYTRTILATY